ncbi:TniQ family protein [Streptomyces sp. VNUA24]|uniref:TniQ family protein n=1 Tax=Streptomyces sp. VNUA24 TaxID=3031131 RepID=UPI0023B8106C|nr:TniQ family protein [Streptomyces sp. VNUA24]WEH12227.1 TniQ family protein [Streptomyces sp. VNUA24]
MGVLVAKPVDLSAVRGEAASSFVVRLAAANGIQPAGVLDDLRVRGHHALDPRTSEVLLSSQGIGLLAVLAGRDEAHLRRTLPTAAAGPVSSRARPARVGPWPAGWTVLAECSGCTARRSDGLPPVWLAVRASWQVCVRHGQWLQGADRAQHISLAGLEEVVEAHRRRMRLEQRVGPYARALLADALQVAGFWWRCRQMGSDTVWARRERALGLARRPQALPLVVYPEAVTVAEAMAVHERQRCWGRDFDNGAPGWVSRRWITWVGERLGMTEQMEHGGYRALRSWTMNHRVAAPVAARLAQTAPPPGYRSGQMQPLEPHRPLSETLEDSSCLPWRLDGPVTSLP